MIGGRSYLTREIILVSAIGSDICMPEYLSLPCIASSSRKRNHIIVIPILYLRVGNLTPSWCIIIGMGELTILEEVAVALSFEALEALISIGEDVVPSDVAIIPNKHQLTTHKALDAQLQLTVISSIRRDIRKESFGRHRHIDIITLCTQLITAGLLFHRHHIILCLMIIRPKRTTRIHIYSTSYTWIISKGSVCSERDAIVVNALLSLFSCSSTPPTCTISA